MADFDDPFSHDAVFRRFSQPRRAEGGIKYQAKRRATPQTWWAERWLSVLESFDLGPRLQRAKSYARKGQVLNISVEKGEVTAAVQGSRRTPYSATIRVKPLTAEQWQELGRIFASQAIYSAKLLSRQMPVQIENAFRDAGLSLFPQREADLKTFCSCPDWSNPCKHIAAVYLLLGEQFDRDPFLIFRLRGMDEDELLELLDQKISGASDASKTSDGGDDQARASAVQDEARGGFDRPLSTNHDDFWLGKPISGNPIGSLEQPEQTAMLAKRLGAFPFWRGEQDFWQSIESVYKRASNQTTRLFTSADEQSDLKTGKKTKKPKN